MTRILCIIISAVATHIVVDFAEECLLTTSFSTLCALHAKGLGPRPVAFD